jgi:hypothetical protein
MKYPKIIGLLVSLQLLLGCASVWAQSGQRFGSVYKIIGLVVATDSAGNTKRELKQGDAVFVGEQFRAAGTGEAVIRTDDAGIIAVRPNASFVMDQFTANGNAEDALTVRILTGALRMITGWTGHYNKQTHRIVTPSATVGIRGTDHEPYVLSPELARDFQKPEGTYNKVNSGATVLIANGVELDVGAGKVGFAPAQQELHPRSLMTALIPTLLEKVPGFFVAGAFDNELEALANEDMAAAKSAGKLAGAMPEETSAASMVAAPPVAINKPVETGTCKPNAIATQWLQELDDAVVNKDGQAFLDKFDSNADVIARVRDGSGNFVELTFSRDEIVRSTFAAFAQLSNFASRRPVIKAALTNAAQTARCDRIDVESIAIESGSRNGSSYRLETLETYQLVKRSGVWVAIHASTTTR